MNSYINNSFSLNEDFYFANFVTYFNSTVFNNYEELCDEFKIYFPKCAAKIMSGAHYYIVKDRDPLYGDFKISEITCREMSNICDNNLFKYKTIEYKKNQPKEGERKQVLEVLLIDCRMMCYHGYTNNPFCKDPFIFNAWVPFKGERTMVENPDTEKVDKIIDFIKDRYCRGNEILLDYLLSWFATIIQNPGEKTKVALVLHSVAQQVGKGTLYDYVSKILIGERYCWDDPCIGQTLNDSFNSQFEGKILLAFDEIPVKAKDFHGAWDTLKAYITGTDLAIKAKYKNPYRAPNMLNCWFNIQRTEGIKIESADQRYFCLHVKEENSNDRDYWKNIRKTIFSKEWSGHFYTYLKKYKCCDMGVIPSTELKRQYQIASLPSPIKFLKEKLEDEDDQDFGHITMGLELNGIKYTNIIAPPSRLYHMYKEWCISDGYDAVNRTSFNNSINIGEPLRKKDFGGKLSFRFYDVNEIKKKYGSF